MRHFGSGVALAAMVLPAAASAQRLFDGRMIVGRKMTVGSTNPKQAMTTRFVACK